MARILVVEDEVTLARVVEDWLLGEQHTVEVVHDGPMAVQKLSGNIYDVIILDWQLPGLSGLEVCKQYRSNGGSAAIIMLTGKREIIDKEQGLDSGADDYLTKPFQMRELSARLRALLRRSRKLQETVITIGNLVLDSSRRAVTKDGKEIQLMPKEYALLEFLMRHPGQVFSHDALIDGVWSEESDASPDTLRVHIKRLREKIDTKGEESIIRTLHRLGYKLEPMPGQSKSPDSTDTEN